MIGTLDIEVQAQNPNFPLDPLYAYVGSPSNIRVRNVPEKIGQWKLTQVCIEVNYPDNSLNTFQCVRTGSTWTATVEGSATSGLVANGYSITASGTDEHGDPASGYVLGKGDVCIMNQDGRVTPSGTWHNMRLSVERPAEACVGDAFFEGDCMKVWNGEDWCPATDISGVRRCVCNAQLAQASTTRAVAALINERAKDL